MGASVKASKLRGKSKRTTADVFPLFLHRNGQWAKKIRGTHHYFGKDKEEARAKYLREIGQLSQGVEPAKGDIGLRELFNRYLTAQEQRMHAGRIGARALSDSAGTLKRVVGILGDRLVSALVSDDFDRLAEKLSKGRSIITVAGDIRRAKAAFNYGVGKRLIHGLPPFGTEFEPAPIAAVRRSRSKRAALMFTAAELRTLLAAADPQLRAIIYLGTNCALLPVDVGRLTFEEIDNGREWLRQARHKTGVDRLAALWPETAEALRDAAKWRIKPARPEYADLVFLTESGLPLVRTCTPAKANNNPKLALNATVINRVTSDFRKLQIACGVYRHGRGFNALRHGFLTVAEASLDFPAVAKVMGHEIGVSAIYREHIADSRVKAVCELVRQWLLTDGKQ